MKNLSLILSVVSLIAVLVLYILHFQGPSSQPELAEDAIEAKPTNLGNLKFAYVNADSLISNFEFFKEKSEELQNERSKSESDLETRARGIERQVNDFQQSRGNMTINQARAVEEDLYKKQQNLLQYRETLAQNLLVKENELNNELYKRITEYMDEYGEAHDMELVLSYTRGSAVLYANDSLDITQVVIDGLNNEYKNPTTQEADSTASN